MFIDNDCSSMPVCDFCVFFDSHSAFDKDGVNVASGLCFKHSKMVDPSGECDDFYCQCCAKEKFCRTIRQDPVGERVCKGYFEDDEIHPMCVKCYQYIDKEVKK